MAIDVYNKWGNPKQQAARANASASRQAGLSAGGVGGSDRLAQALELLAAEKRGEQTHGLTATERTRLRRRFEQSLPRSASHAGPGRAQEFFDGFLPAGAQLAPNAGRGYADAQRQAAGPSRGWNRTASNGLPQGGALTGDGGSTFSTTSKPYMPEFESPDRQSYPVHRILANIYWRLFYKLDPIIGAGIDLYSELPWGNFDLSGEGVDGEIKDALEHMCAKTQIRAMLPYFVKEYMVVGEAVPHTFFDDDLGIWTYIGMHNPDQIEVVHTPFIEMDPILRFRPDDRLRQVLSSGHPMAMQVRESMPPELLSALTSGQHVELSPLNCTFLPRKLHPYDVRGTSILSRMWRILMLEDGLFNASIATVRRQACFVAGTPVLTPTGVRPIEEIKEGDLVVSGAGKTETVKAAWAEPPSEAGLIEIKALGTEPLFCTPSHNFLVWASPRHCACGCGQVLTAKYTRPDGTTRSRRSAFIHGHSLAKRDPKTGRMAAGSGIDWKVYSTEPKLRVPEGYEPMQKLPAAALRKGDYLVIPRAFELSETSARPEKARLLGYYAAEGSARDVWNGPEDNRHLTCAGVALTFSLDEAETWAVDAVACAAKLGAEASLQPYIPASDTKTAETGREGRTNVYIQKAGNEPLAVWLRDNGGVGAQEHILSPEVMGWSLELKREFVRGYYRGDGHLGFPDGCPQVTACTTSQTLAYQTRLVLAQLGFFASVSYCRDQNDGQWSDKWVLSTTGRDARALAQIVWGVDIAEPARGPNHGGAARTWADDDYVYTPISSVTAHADEVVTYNLSVTGDESYVVAGVQTFNSPVKVAKTGDRASGWIPSPEQDQRLLDMLVNAEQDPASWLVWNYGVEFDLVGVQDRVWKIDQSAEFIDRVKMMALGISKSFLWGEVTYACAVEDTPIHQTDHSTRPIQDIRRGDLIVDRDGVEQTVVNAWDEGIPSHLYRLELHGGKSITFTENHRHPVWAWPRICACGCGESIKPGTSVRHGHGGRAKAAGVEYIAVDQSKKPRKIPKTHDPLQKLRTDEIRAGDCLLIPRTFKVQTPPPDITAAHARLLGYYVAEGCPRDYNGDKTSEWSLSADEKETLGRDIVELCRQVGVATWHPNKQKDTTFAVVSSQPAAIELQHWLDRHAGHLAKHKQLSSDVMGWPLEFKLELIRGAFRGDGSQTLYTRSYKGKTTGPYLEVEYSTASPQLAQQLWMVLIQLGFFMQFNERNRTDDREDWPDETTHYALKMQGDDAMRFADLVWGDDSLASQVKKERTVRSTVRFDENFAYVPVKSVKRIPNDKLVYNLEVTGSHTYLADGFATYNSAQSGLTVFLQRLKALRDYFESTWIYPKFFRPVAEMNAWVKPTQAELDHNVRTRRSHRELREDNRYIVPKVEWDRSLDPSVDSAMISAVQALRDLGVAISDQTKASLINRDWEDEFRKSVQEAELKAQILKENPEAAALMGGQPPGGAGGGGMMPGVPSAAMGFPDEGGEGGGEPGGDLGGLDMAVDQAVNGLDPGMAAGEGEAGAPGRPGAEATTAAEAEGWDRNTVQGLANMIRDRDTHAAPEPWDRMVADEPEIEAALAEADPLGAWEAVKEWLMGEGYPSSSLRALQQVLVAEQVLPAEETLRLAQRYSERLEKKRAHALLSGADAFSDDDTNLLRGC